MTSELEKKCAEAARLKQVLLENDNIGVLLYLAKYNPQVTRRVLAEKFGKTALKGLEDLKKFCLVAEKNRNLSLTPEGIFQVDGLLASVA